jgi:hypothetical protein
MDGNSGDTQFLAGPDNPQGDLAAVRDQYFLKGSR